MRESQPSDLKERYRLEKREFREFPCEIYQTRQVYRKGMIVKHHWHDEIEIIYFAGGTFTMTINLIEYRVEPPCLFFINPGELHSISSSEPQDYGDDAVVFSPDILCFESRDRSQEELIAPITDGELLFPRCIGCDHPAFVPLLNAFSEIFHSFGAKEHEEELRFEYGVCSDDLSAQLLIRASLLKILAILSANSLFISAGGSSDKKVEGIKTALKYIEDNYRQKIYISDLAGLLNLNEQYFCRYFKKAIGCSPVSYINEYRIKQAVRLLKETDLSVMDVCLECGYNNLGNFFRAFRRYTSMTPMQYRKSQNSEI